MAQAPHLQAVSHFLCARPLEGPHAQVFWSAPGWVFQIGTPRAVHNSASGRVMQKVHALSQSGGHSFWRALFPQRIQYSTNINDVDLVQLSELWAKTLNVARNPTEIAKALKHSYSIVAALDLGEDEDFSQPRLVGFGRAVSDGAFIATICDVAVDPAYQRRGIGRTLVKELVKNMKKSDGPTGFAVFPRPKTRLFFWRIGFRSDQSYKFMTYSGRLLEGVFQHRKEEEP
ncbi:hypothetical protein KP509_35G032000 [Ceratopteris richardii]|uniref:N-acetyltransferase domain-containing protein n=1 Tax=Ceratopteris richardii TaxID=49495 RepID=A0A8T2QFX4_CERRI|nr:hypothetical protein KP509_35G032000 [Ceratopteris richardii]